MPLLKKCCFSLTLLDGSICLIIINFILLILFLLELILDLADEAYARAAGLAKMIAIILTVILASLFEVSSIIGVYKDNVRFLKTAIISQGLMLVNMLFLLILFGWLRLWYRFVATVVVMSLQLYLILVFDSYLEELIEFQRSVGTTSTANSAISSEKSSAKSTAK